MSYSSLVRLGGTLCIVGGAVLLLLGLRFLVEGGAVEDGLTGLMVGIWALGGICGVLGMIALEATGTNPIVRIVSYLPVVAFLVVLLGIVYPIGNTANGWNVLIAFGLLGLLVGLVLNGVFVLRANVWSGWKQIVPFLPAIMPFVGIAIDGLIGTKVGVNVGLIGLSWMLLGYVLTMSPARELAVSR